MRLDQYFTQEPSRRLESGFAQRGEYFDIVDLEDNLPDDPEFREEFVGHQKRAADLLFDGFGGN